MFTLIMINLNNNPFIHDTGLNEENSLMHLLDAISPDEEDEAILFKHSKYFDNLSFKNTLCKQNGKISLLSLNCQSINQGRIYCEANEASASGTHVPLRDPHQNFNAVSKVYFLLRTKSLKVNLL